MLAISQPLLQGAQSLNQSNVASVYLSGAEGYDHSITWDAGSLGGEVTVEAADSPTFAGTWAFIGKVSGPAAPANAPKMDLISGSTTGKYVRHRVSQALAGGTVSSRIKGTE